MRALEKRANNVFRLIIFCLLATATAHASEQEYGFFVEKAELSRQGDRYVLNADIDYRFSEEAIEALENGVPLTLDVCLRIEQHRRFVWNKTLADVVLTYRIRHHALAKLFQVINEGSGVRRNFASLEAAVDFLGSVRGVPVVRSEKLAENIQYEAALRVELNREALPLPLRPVSYLKPQWYLASSWHTWLLEK